MSFLDLLKKMLGMSKGGSNQIAPEKPVDEMSGSIGAAPSQPEEGQVMGGESSEKEHR